MAQPPLSRQVHRLGDEFGVLLFEKNMRPLRLTAAGVFFEVHARAVLAAAADLKSMIQRFGKIKHALAIGFVASTLYDLLPEILRRFRARYEDGRIDVGFGRIEARTRPSGAFCCARKDWSWQCCPPIRWPGRQCLSSCAICTQKH